MRKLSDLASLLREEALRKQRAAQMRRAGTPGGVEDPSGVYQSACEAIGTALAPDGFRYAKSGPRLTRKVGEFTHHISFQSSHNNVRGEYVALWIHVGVRSKLLKAWRKRYEPGVVSDSVAGGQIGNLDANPGWSEWDLADPASRSGTIDDAIGTIRSVVLPFLALFSDRPAALRTIDQWPRPGLEILPAIELALSYDDQRRAQALLKDFFDRHPELKPEYEAKLVEFRTTGFPPYRHGAYAPELARASLLYGLKPV